MSEWAYDEGVRLEQIAEAAAEAAREEAEELEPCEECGRTGGTPGVTAIADGTVCMACGLPTGKARS